MRTALLIGVCMAGWALPVQARQEPTKSRAPQAVRTTMAQARPLARDTLLGRPSVNQAHRRLDARQGVTRAAYRISARSAPRATSLEAAQAYLARSADAFGWMDDLADLRHIETRHSPAGLHLVFQQTFAGLPVYHRVVKVSLDHTNRPTMAVSGYAPHLTGEATFNSRPSLPAAQARLALQNAVDGALQATTPELVVYAADPPRLAWAAIVWSGTPLAEWAVLVDAHTGTPLQVVNQTVNEWPGPDAHTTPHRNHPSSPSPPVASASPLLRPAGSAVRRVDGSGYVFDPDPLTTSGRPYGGAYVDAGDLDTDELNAERVEVPLLDIAQGTDGLYRLEGPYVRITGERSTGAVNYTPPTEADPHAFRYTRSDDRFEAVNVYYHIDNSQRYVQALGFSDVQNGSIPANPFGDGPADNSQFFPSLNFLSFGTGGIDDAEDADVIWHEYGHALLEGASPGLRATLEGQSLHEGWSDYWAASYRRSFYDAGVVPAGDWRRLFPWDGNNAELPWFGRTLDAQGVFSGKITNIYTEGVLWATTLMEIFDAVGREVSDRLNLQSHYYLSVPTTYRDAAEALLQADLDLYDGTHSSLIIQVMGDRGYLNPADFGPVVAHTPLNDTEQIDGTIPVEVEASSQVFPVQSVYVVARVGQAEPIVLPADPQGDGRYVARLPLPSTTAIVTYYVEVVDSQGRRTLLPANAPTDTFRFQAGPDEIAPVVVATPIPVASLIGWPATVTAQVTDNLGVDTVTVAYEVLDGTTGTVRLQGTFGLRPAGEVYAAPFPIPVEDLMEGDKIRYRITARDQATAGNETFLPALEEEPYGFTVWASGILTVFDFEGPLPGVQSSGEWARAAPTFGIQTAHSGTSVWATVPDGPYSAEAGLSRLELPPVDVSPFEQVYLVLWHWYDFEHNGEARPEGGAKSLLFDGGNVKLSTDGGTTWTILEPEGGYTGTINDRFVNPLRGEPAFGGYSYGWRREVFRLPSHADVRLRFEVGTDDGNSEASVAFAGWYLDDITFTVERPVDEAPPEVLEAPPALVELAATPTTRSPSITVRAQDDVGFSRVELEYTGRIAGRDIAGQTRLAMSSTDPTLFRGEIPVIEIPGTAAPGDYLDYRLHLTDYGDRTLHIPAENEPPLRIRYLLWTQNDVLQQVVSPSGFWTSTATGWALAEIDAAPNRSSLVFSPQDLAVNAERIQAVVRHAYRLADGAGGNLKLSTDAGATWTTLAPIGGYDASFGAEAAVLAGEPVFTGSSSADTVETVFDLSEYAGRQVQLRLDFGTGHPLSENEFWRVDDVAINAQTGLDAAFETPRELKLHANFPDPFATTTTITYTLAELLPVRLEVFDMLGRRVAVLVDAEQPAGTYSRLFNGTGMANGLYVVKLSVGEMQLIEKMTIAR